MKTPTMIQLSTEVEIKELAVAMIDAGQDEVYDLILALDEMQSDWSFTLRLADHFDRQRKAFEAEGAEDEPPSAALKEFP